MLGLAIALVAGLVWAYSTNQSAWSVLGQADFVSNPVNGSTGLPGLNTLASPFAITGDAAGFFVADFGNNRILIYNSVPTNSNASAATIWGQPNAGVSQANQGLGAPTSLTLSSPQGVCTNGSQFFISDTGNNRILVFNSVPTSPSTQPNFVLGQGGSFTTSSTGTGSAQFSEPTGIFASSSYLYVADTFNNRVQIFALPINSSAQAAVSVLGQTATSGLVNGGNGQASVSQPHGVWADPNFIYVADSANNRILIYPVNFSGNGPNAMNVVGQTAYNTGAVNAGNPSPVSFGFNAPKGVCSDPNNNLFVADTSNNRVLVFNPIPISAPGASAISVIGQSILSGATAGSANQGGTPAANTLDKPIGLWMNSSDPLLWVADEVNNRVLSYNSTGATPTPGGGPTNTPTATNTPSSACLPTEITKVFNSVSNNNILVLPSISVSGTNPLLLVQVAIQPSGQSVLSITDTFSGAYIQKGTNSSPPNNDNLEVFYSVPPSTGTDAITIHFSNAVTAWGGAILYNGVNQTNPIGPEAIATVTNASVGTLSMSTTGTGSLIVDLLKESTPSSISYANGQNQIWQVNGNSQSAASDQVPAPTPGLYALTYSLSGGPANMTLLAVELEGAGCAGSATSTATPTSTPTACGSGSSLNLNWSTKTSMPVSIYAPGVASIGTTIYVIGGYSTTYLNTVYAYDTVGNSWSTLAPMFTARDYLGVGVVNGKIYAIGGLNSSSYLNNVEAYDPVANSWTSIGLNTMTTAREVDMGVVNGILYAVGGYNGNFLSTVESYDPVANQWTTEQSMPTARDQIGVGVVNGILYAIGGGNLTTTQMTTVESYNPVGNSWTAGLPSMPIASWGPGVGVVNGLIYVVGGSPSNFAVENTVQVFNPSGNSWSSMAPMPTGRELLGAAVVNGNIYALGGATGLLSPFP